MNDPALVILLLGALILALGLPSRRLARGVVPPELAAMCVGVLVGPAVLGLIDITAMAHATAVPELLARLALGIGLVGVALQVPRAYPRREWRDIAILLGLGMPMMWLVSTLLVWLLVDVPLPLAALIGAMVTPTDPIGASPVVTGELAESHLPGRVRHIISFESGANDGVSHLLVFLPLLLLTMPAGEVMSHWLLHTLLREVGGGVLLGLALGWAAARMLQVAERADAIEGDWRLVYTVAVALTAIGAGSLVGVNELLVAFAAGAAFVQVVSEHDREEEEHGQEAVNRFFAVPMFAIIGSMIPWAGWRELGWTGALLAASVLLLRRPPVLLLLRPLLRHLPHVRDALFVGWFGPIAIAAFYYCAVAGELRPDSVAWHVVSLLIVASSLAHGMTAAAATRLYGRAETRAQARPPAQAGN